MDKDYLITIDGKQTVDDGIESVSLSTLGSFERRDGVDYICYEETDATGFLGDVTTLMVEAGDRATILRQGRTNSRLVIERGHKHMCHYDTGFGSITVGILAERIENKLKKNGGRVRLRYALDLNANTLAVNELNITVKESAAHV